MNHIYSSLSELVEALKQGDHHEVTAWLDNDNVSFMEAARPRPPRSAGASTGPARYSCRTSVIRGNQNTFTSTDKEKRMPEEALPCIVCERRLDNAFPSSENQPSEGTSFSTRGHYGSTFFDPMDGQTIEINICDDCLSKRRDQGGFILWRRAFKEIKCENFLVGREWIDRPRVPYTSQDEAGENDVLHVEPEDLGTDKFGDRVEWIRSTELERTKDSIRLMLTEPADREQT